MNTRSILSVMSIIFSPIFGSLEELRENIIQAPAEGVVIEVGGAVTEGFLDFLSEEGLLVRCQIVCNCFSKMIFSPRRWLEYRGRGLVVAVRRAVRILALTVNPVSPTGAHFPPDAFLHAVRRAVPNIPVFDVCSSNYGVEWAGSEL